ncbi:hypothetical protein BGX38DRAFT_1144064 [Terfezia claveryi]|nr:hypothetical protein BGX38DRAFT_1144064 [Terfezia claveryi]
MLSSLCAYIKENPRNCKRIIKCAVALAFAVGMTIHHPLVDIWGANPYLVGTTSVGGQIVSTCAALIGALLGVAWANLALFLANQFQSSRQTGDIETGRQATLWTFFVICSLICGYIRSKHPRLYLSIVFAMMVNMFALIRGISDFRYVFRRFFIVMGVGAVCSMFVSIVLWPEDHSTILRENTQAALAEFRQAVLDAERSTRKRPSTEEINLSALAAAVKKLATSFKESGYEISLSRVDARDLVPLSTKLETFVDIVKVYNCAVRAHPPPPDAEDAEPYIDNPKWAGKGEESKEDTSTGAISFAFLEAVRVIDLISARVKDAYDSKTGTRGIPAMEIAGFETLRDSAATALSQERGRWAGGVRSVEELSFIDMINTVILQMLDTVHAAARASNDITSTGKLHLFWPVKLRRRARNKPADFDISCEPAPSGLDNDLPEYSEFDTERGELMSMEFVYVQQNQKWHTRLAACISQKLSGIKHSRHVKYGVKFAIVMGILSVPAYIADNYIWFDDLRVQCALISAMIAMETTRGMTFRNAGMKLCGAVCGGLSAFMTMHISFGNEQANVVIALFIGLGVGYMINCPNLAKAGIVFAFAFNIVIGVAQTSPNHDTTEILARRLITLPIGLTVAMIVHVGIFPFHARKELGRAISTGIDWLHHLLHAIALTEEEDPAIGPAAIVTEEQFAEVISKTKRRVRFANGLIPATRYEISLVGKFPEDKFQQILERLGNIVLLSVGTENAKEAGPVLLDVQMRGYATQAHGREQLLGSLCNDLLVISHTLSARLYMPRHISHSSVVLGDYISLFKSGSTTATPSRSQSRAATPTGRRSSISIVKNAQIQFDVDSKAPQHSTSNYADVGTANYADVGRLITLVNEMGILRTLVDSLIVDSHVNPTAKAMFPQWSIPSRPVSRWTPSRPVSRISRAPSWGGSRANSWALTRAGSKVVPPLPAKPEMVKSRTSTDRWQGGSRDSRNGSDRDPGNLV